MMKLGVVLAGLVFGICVANAANYPGWKRFRATDNTGKSCKLAKYAGNQWLPEDDHSINNQWVSAVTVSKANAEYSNFKYQNTWYAARNACLLDPGQASSASGPAPVGYNPKYFIDFRLTENMVLGSGASPYSVGSVNVTSTKYSSGVGFSGRFGYELGQSSPNYLFLDVGYAAGSYTANYAGSITGSAAGSDSLTRINVGWQRNFVRAWFWGFRPFAAVALDYTKVSGTLQGPVSSGGVSAGNVAAAYSGSGIGLMLEGGLNKQFNTHWSMLLDMMLTFVSVNPSVSESYATALYALGSQMPSHSYSTIGISAGVRYSF